jgi:predicted metal-dependent HD superfamily phosphohydrolase
MIGSRDHGRALRQSWHSLLGTWGVDASQADRRLQEIVQAYSSPDRFYHTLDHITDVLSTVERLATHAKNLNAVRLAAWLHDVIYDTKASDNEERSAEYAARLSEELTIPEGPLVASFIRVTKTHDAGEDPDAKVLIDADLAILGAREPVYRDYAEKIRQEYSWVPEEQYRNGRRRVLESFLRRPRIYHLLSELEEPARRNLTAEIASLSS